MRLSRDLGIPYPVLQRQLTSKQFNEYLALYVKHPPPLELLNVNLARLLALTHNVNRKKGTTKRSAFDFLPDSYKPKMQTYTDPSEIFQQLKRTLSARPGGLRRRTKEA